MASTGVFNLSKALKGHPVGFNASTPCRRFRKLNDARYSAVYNNQEYFFDYDGKCEDGVHQLYMLYDTISEVQDSKDDIVTRSSSGDGSTSGNVTVSALKPRDYFAQEALNGILKGISDPLELEDYDIKDLVALSYKIAQEMLDKSIAMRAMYEADTNDVIYSGTTRGDADSGKTSFSKRMDVPSPSGNTEKLLYNIWKALDDANLRYTATMDENTTNMNNLKLSMDNITTALNKIATALSKETTT